VRHTVAVRENARIADRYLLSTPLGRGAMGEVWEGYDERLDRRVAVKFVRRRSLPDSTDYDTLVKRFLREARISAKLDHPGVPTVYDAGKHDGEAYLIMQLVTGHNLADLLAERGPLPVSWAAATGAQICSVLAVAHAASLVHRDLKPRNVMLCPDGSVKVLDFGIAVILDTIDPTRLTTTGQILGTPAYMAPEQASGTPVGSLADLYALGCVLHELLAGTPPFVADSPLAVVGQHLYAEPVPLRSVRPDVPPALEALVLRLLAKDPGRRPADAAEVYYALLPHVTGGGKSVDLGPTRPYHYPLGPLPVLPGSAPTEVAPRPVLPPDPDAAVRALDEQRERAVALMDEGRITRAGEVLASAAQAAGEELGTGHPDVVDARLALAHVYLLGGDHRRALPELQRLIPDLTTHYGGDHDFVWDAKRSVAACYAALGQHTEAVSALRSLLAERRRVRGADDPELTELRTLLGRLGG
jgi:tRNA A-37 threonylcarbamoyl transferase component Bud32